MSRLSSPNCVLQRLEALFRDAAVQLDMECRDGRWRVRYRRTDASGKRRRRSITLPDDAMLLAAVKERLQRRREKGKAKRRAVAEKKALRRLKRQIVAKSGRGRWLRRRIGKMFDLAACLGPEMLNDYIDHEPWRARGKPAGRPQKRTHCSDDWGQNGNFYRDF